MGLALHYALSTEKSKGLPAKGQETMITERMTCNLEAVTKLHSDDVETGIGL